MTKNDSEDDVADLQGVCKWWRCAAKELEVKELGGE